jgi:hypothetical protein
VTARDVLDETRERLEAPSSGLNWLVAGLLEAIVNAGLETLDVDADDAEVDVVESRVSSWGSSARWVVLRGGGARFQALFSLGGDGHAVGMIPGSARPHRRPGARAAAGEGATRARSGRSTRA